MSTYSRAYVHDIVTNTTDVHSVDKEDVGGGIVLEKMLLLLRTHRQLADQHRPCAPNCVVASLFPLGVYSYS